MKNAKNNSRKLSLGKELSKNAQKNIMGGIIIVCTGGTFNTQWGTDCSGQQAYCAAAGHGSFITCYPG